MRLIALVLASAALLTTSPGAVGGQAPARGQVQERTPDAGRLADSAFARARRLVTEGNGAAGRALLDSMVQGMPASDPALPEALWWRATLAETAAAAERDFLRLAVEHPAAPRASDALVRLGQLEYARGARDAAVRHFERLVREHPDQPALGTALQWKGRILIELGQAAAGCAALDSARAGLSAGDAERRLQLDYLAQGCGAGAPAAGPAAPSSGPAARPPSPAAPPAVTGTGPPVRVAAGTLPTRARAEALLRRVEAAGFEGRVAAVGTRKFRVFVGGVMPASAGRALVAALAAKKLRGAVLLPEPTGTRR